MRAVLIPIRGAALCWPLLNGLLLAGCAQSDPGHLLALSAEPTTTASIPAGVGGDRRASADSSMNANAIRPEVENFSACIAGLWPQAARHGITRANFVAYTAALTPDLHILDLLDRQPEFTKSIWDYLDMLVTESRINRGREILARYQPTFDAVERTYGVDRHIIAAVWGIESNFGTAAGNRPVLRSTGTLACIGRRQAYFRDEFLAALEILQHGDLRPEQLKGSWAGAFGPTQFMPTAFKRYAVDFDGDGRRDVVDSIPDLIASTANNLKKDGWQPGKTWGYEVVVPKGFNYLLADGHKRLTISQWERYGVRRVEGKAFPREDDTGYLLLPAGAEGPAFLMLRNFDVIMRYNPSEAYALAIGHLADRMRGGGQFVHPWPRQEPVLSRNQRYELQQRLAGLGYDVGEPDGRLGPKTRTALRAFQLRSGRIPDGFASADVLQSLRRL